MIAFVPGSFSLENLHRAYLRCRLGKRNAIYTREFESNLYGNLERLSIGLETGTYSPSRSVCFYVTKPKLREIFAADFGDRVVHRLLVDILEPCYEKWFIHDSFACRKGKGTHAAVARLRHFIRKRSANARSPLYFLQLDIKGFFMSLSKAVLYSILEKRIGDPKLSHLCRANIFHNPTDYFIFRGKRPAAGILPPHKTLFHDDRERGIPIGNLTSQFFANVYLNELDQFAKHKLRIKYYLRYVDDFICLDTSPARLVQWRSEIISFLERHLRLELKDPATMPVSVYKGIDFLGYFIKPRYVLLRRRVVRNLKAALKTALPGPQKTKEQFTITQFHPDWKKWQILQSRVNSYLAHSHYANNFHLVGHLKNILAPYGAIIEIRDGFVRLLPRKPDRFQSFREQLVFFLNRFKDRLLIIQLGKFYELYGRDVFFLANALGLKKYERNGRFETFGLPVHKIGFLLNKAMKFKISLVLIRQAGELSDRVKTRLPAVQWSLARPVQMELFFTP